MVKLFDWCRQFPVAGYEIGPTEWLAHPFYLRANGFDAAIFGQIFDNREYDFEFEFQPKSLIDAGANIGCATVWFKQKYPACCIMAVEPAADNFTILKRNTRPYKGLRLLQAALLDRRGEVNFRTVDRSGNYSLGPDAYCVAYDDDEFLGCCTVAAVSLADLFTLGGIDELDILKLDIEGAEIEVLGCGNDACLARTRAIIVEPHDRFREGCTAAIEAAARRHNFKISSLGEYLYLTRRGSLST